VAGRTYIRTGRAKQLLSVLKAAGKNSDVEALIEQAEGNPLAGATGTTDDQNGVFLEQLILCQFVILYRVSFKSVGLAVVDVTAAVLLSHEVVNGAVELDGACWWLRGSLSPAIGVHDDVTRASCPAGRFGSTLPECRGRVDGPCWVHDSAMTGGHLECTTECDRLVSNNNNGFEWMRSLKPQISRSAKSCSIRPHDGFLKRPADGAVLQQELVGGNLLPLSARN
jgi:hypothetical protein